MSCKTCKMYSEFVEPRVQKNKDGNEYTITGYCFKKIGQPDYHKGYAVFLPDGSCKSYVKRKGAVEAPEGQLSLPLMR